MAKNAVNVVQLKAGPADDAVAALNLGKLQRAKESLESENGRFRNVVKHVEAKGIHLKAAKRALAISKAENCAEIVEELKKLSEYLAILGVPLSRDQLDLFRTQDDAAPAEDKAREAGRYAGIMGEGTGANPYSAESPQGQAWVEAWHGGVAERDLVLALEPADDSELIKGGEDPDFTADDPEWEGAEPAEAAE